MKLEGMRYGEKHEQAAKKRAATKKAARKPSLGSHSQGVVAGLPGRSR